MSTPEARGTHGSPIVIEVGLRYDLRTPGLTPRDRAHRYHAALAQCTWADGQGFGRVTLSEHHASDDGYLPSPIVFASAVAGRTSSIALKLSLLLLPLHDPIHLAEDLAVLDLVSGGRLRPVFGAGYRSEDFRLFGVSVAERAARMEHGIRTIRRAWTGEPIDVADGPIYVTPRPFQDPHPPIVLGGSSGAAARRAARLADAFEPVGGPGPVYEMYLEACENLGRDPGLVRPVPGQRSSM